jgi:hypothetical protein
MRFIVSAGSAISQSVSFANLLDTMLVATSATSGVDIWDAVRVKAVEIWATGVTGSANTPTTVTVDFAGATGADAGDGRVWSDTSVSVEPAHIRAIPSKLSSAGHWQQSSAFVAFTLPFCPPGAVVDVEMEFRNSSIAPVTAANALVGATIGQFYYRGLDGLALSGTRFTPQAVITV